MTNTASPSTAARAAAKAAVFEGIDRAQACLTIQSLSLSELEDRALGCALAMLTLQAQDEIRNVERAAIELLGGEHE